MTNFEAVESLKKSEANLKAIIENSLESIWSIDRNYCIQYVNEVFIRAFEESFGESLDIGVNILEALPESLRDLWKERYDRAFNNEHFVFSDKIEQEEGDIYIEVAMNPILLDGEVIGASFYGKNVTERKKYERQLVAAKEKAEEFEERYNALYERSNDFVYIHDLEGKFIDANEATLSMFGYERDEVPALNFLSLLDPQDLPRAMEEIASLLKEGTQKGKTEFRLRKKNGEAVYVETRSSLIMNDGEAVAIQGIARDITERKLAEESIKKLDLAIRQSREIVFITDREGIITYMNPQFTNVYGHRAEDVVGKETPRILKSGLFSEQEHAYIWQMLLNKEGIKAEYKNRRKDGRLIDIEGTADPILDDNGEIIGFLGIHRDISDRKRFEEDLIKAKEKAEESEMELKYSQKIALIGYYKLDFISGLWSSSEMLDEIFGIDENYVRDVEGWLSIVHPDFKEEMLDYFQNSVVTNRESFNKQYTILKKKTGECRWVHGYGTLEFGPEGELMTMFGTIQDITSMKQAEIELQLAKDKAEESDRLKTAFLANMSHEIRTPMNGILGFLSLLGKTDLSDDTRDRYISILNSSGERLLNTINDIIEISKIESGDVQMAVSPIDIRKLATFYYDFFLPETQEKGLHFNVVHDKNFRSRWIHADKNKLDSILTNLIKNAIKFTRTGSIEFGYRLKGNALEFFVKDTGIGIRKESLDFVFDRFTQLDQGKTRIQEGSGVGLSISKAYVEMMGGRISVESEEDKGSTFYFTIPMHVEKELTGVEGKMGISGKGENEETHPGSRLSKSIKILIAEDDDVSAEYLTTLLKTLNCQLITCENGAEALEICRKNRDIDLVLMDIQMPVMNGYEATRRIREFNREVIIIAQTAYALEGDNEAALEAGCNEYIPKPVNDNRLMATIGKYFPSGN